MRHVVSVGDRECVNLDFPKSSTILAVADPGVGRNGRGPPYWRRKNIEKEKEEVKKKEEKKGEDKRKEKKKEKKRERVNKRGKKKKRGAGKKERQRNGTKN